MKSLVKIGFAAIAAVCLLAPWSSYATDPALLADDEVEYFIKYFSNRAQPVPRPVYGELEFSGITDTRLYDIVAERFLAESKATDYDAIDHAAWLSKAVAYSGESKYLDTLNQVLKTSKNPKLQRYVKEAIENSPRFHAWNADISRDTASLRGEALYRKRTLNMLRSSDSFLVMFGAKRVWFHHPTDAEYVKVASEQLELAISKPKPSTRDVDAIGWLCNVLGKSGNPAYKPQLDKLAKQTKENRIRQYARTNSRDLK